MRETPRAPVLAAVTGVGVYAAHCAGCHGTDRRGRDPVPSLLDLGRRMSTAQVEELLERGRGFMPPFAMLAQTEKCAVIGYVLGAPCRAEQGTRPAAPGPPPPPYVFAGYERWRDSSGRPAIKPPWGTLSAIDLNTGEYVWHIPLGEPSGTEQYGGPVVTAGGLVFIAATMDAKFRAFDKQTGRLLWEATLPAAGYATPSTFSVGGKQYVVIAAGGGKLGTKSGDAYVAYALP
jgi:quinoprotein glucose dehydrogenase